MFALCHGLQSVSVVLLGHTLILKLEDAQSAHKNDKSTNLDLFALCQEDSTERLIMSQDAYGRYKVVTECIHEFQKHNCLSHSMDADSQAREGGIVATPIKTKQNGIKPAGI